MTTRRKRSQSWYARISRDGILFAAGLLGIGYETILKGGDRPTLLVLFGAMVGLPAFLRTDEKKHEAAEDEPVQEEK